MSTRTPNRVAFALVAATLALAGCTSSGGVRTKGSPTQTLTGESQGHGAGVDPCTLVSLADAEHLAGGTLTLQPHAQLADNRICDYEPKSGAAPFVELHIWGPSFLRADTVAQRWSSEHGTRLTISGHPALKLGSEYEIQVDDTHLLSVVVVPAAAATKIAKLAASRL